MELQLINGRDIEEIRLGQLKLQHEVLNRQLATERDLDPDELTFLDRALPDSLAYYNFLNLPADEKLVNALQSARYNKIFVLDLLPLKNDDVRIEDLAAQKEIHRNVIEVYTARGEEVVIVPVLSIKERVEFILNNL